MHLTNKSWMPYPVQGAALDTEDISHDSRQKIPVGEGGGQKIQTSS